MSSTDSLKATIDGVGFKGDEGLSAYEVAVENGFVGTEAQWLESLKKPAQDAAATMQAYLNNVVAPAESGRVENEQGRVSKEMQRRENETQRISNENARKQNETSRQSTFTGKMADWTSEFNSSMTYFRNSVDDAVDDALDASGAATAAASGANAAKTAANAAAAAANTAAAGANTAKDAANAAASGANAAKASANAAATAANTAASVANTAKDAANAAASSANSAASSATSAATDANTAKDAANSAASSATSAATSANAAASAASTAAESANAAASNATEKAEEAQALIDSSSAAQLSGEIGKLDKRVSTLEEIEKPDLSFGQIRKIVSEGLASKYFKIGDQILVPWKDVAANVEYTIPFDVCHFFDGSDEDHPLVTMADGSTKYGMALMAHYAMPFGTSVSGREPFYIVPEGGLAAGTYNVTFTEKWGSNVVAGKTYQFTTDMDCPAGYQLLGFYGAPDQNPSSWRVYVFDGAASATPLKTYTVSEGSDGTNLGSFKNTSVNGAINALQRVAYAYNNASKSALHQWLNSSAGVGQWWEKQHEWDRIPINANYSTTKSGFLTGFSEDFLSIVGDVQIKTQGNNNTDGSVIDTYHGKFFPISAKQHYFNNYLSETVAGYEASGVPWDYWKQLAEANGHTSPWAGWSTYPELITYDLAGVHTSACYVWLRSAYCSSAYSVGVVYSSGYVNSSSAYYGHRCAPACVIC